MTGQAKSILLALVLCAAAIAAPSPWAQDSPSDPGYLERVQSKAIDDVRVSVAALSAEESAAVYQAPLAERRIQPVWVQVDNRSGHPYWLLFPGLDPNFLPASEAAEAMALYDRRADAGELATRFRNLAFRNPVPAGSTVSGFVLTNLHEGVKFLQVDLFGDQKGLSFSFLSAVPGLRTDYEKSKELRDSLMAVREAGQDFVEDAAFRAALEALPCCVTNKEGTKNGDPLNLVVIGGVEDAFPAFIRRGWTPTEVTWKGSVMRMVKSAMAKEAYAYAPVSDLYLFGRPQDVALQKARDNIHQRNHLRLWRSAMRYHGKPVWVGQISRDIGSRMTIHSPTLTTHKIDPDVDEAAHALIEDLVYSQGLRAIGLVGGVGAASKESPRRNLTTDPYYTRGLRFVLVFTSTPTSLTEIEMLPWERPGGGFVEQVTKGSPP